MAARSVIRKSNGQYHFVLKAANREIIIATSERYTAKDAAKNGIDSVKANASARVDDETGES